MNHKILFVDDEPSVLNGVQRMLGFEYDLHVASGGTEALELIETEGPFSVIFTDMRMPGMNGIEFLQHVQMLAPDSIYVMLTGNSDQETTANAVNQGHVFRFLNKPCERDVIERAIDASVRQYELVMCEKVLLSRTFAGAVKVLTDVIQVTKPELAGLASHIEEKIVELAEMMSIPERWEYRMAARLSLVGFSLVRDEEQALIRDAKHALAARIKLLDQSNEISKRLLGEIPRLEQVAEIVLESSSVTGQFPSNLSRRPTDTVTAGAILLRAATLWELMTPCVQDVGELVYLIQDALPDAPDCLISCIRERARERLPMPGDRTGQTESSTERGVQVRSTAVEGGSCVAVDVSTIALEEGMVTAEETRSQSGVLLIKAGQGLSEAMIERLKTYREVRSIKVLQPVAEAPIEDDESGIPTVIG